MLNKLLTALNLFSNRLNGKYVFKVEVFFFFLFLSSWAESHRILLFELVSNTNSGALE